MSGKPVHIASLGCPKNQIDAEVMAAALTRAGYILTDRAEEAGIIIVNTCAFILPAKEESIDEILRAALKKREQGGNCEHLVVSGCLPQRYGKLLEKALPEVDLFLGTAEFPRIARHLDRLIAGDARQARVIISKPDFIMDAATPRFPSAPSFRAYLKIAEGCDNRCAYCVIPDIRGRFRSRPVDDVLAEAENLVGQGAKEIILIAQDTTAYGKDLKGKPGLAELLPPLAKLKGLHWLRVLYSHPAGLDERLLRVMAKEEKICPYIDLPIQHIDDGLLSAMYRRAGSGRIREVIAAARTIIPGVALRTSLIVGFPGETSGSFGRLIDFAKEVRFDHLGVFSYSREEGTPAAALPRQVGERVKERRRALLLEEQAVISFEINQTLIGTLQDVLIEGPGDGPDYPFAGRCRRQAPEIDGVTYVRGGTAGALSPGDIIPCRITAADTYDLYAEVLR
ncbi:MAG: 30S ribosomal protein S12 methylthiotransferase RimO [Deltaproteobacteria bacterium]|nr:30S ribosomal protein S12 methylthiotransferase RimO [Deltaproteobacteria bacterium]